MNSESNLVHWPKGVSGNPKGRPRKERCIPDLLRWSGKLNAPPQLVAKMRQVFNIPPDAALTVDQASILALRAECLKGSIAHIQFWADRTEGKVTDTLEVTGRRALEVVEEVVEAGAAITAGETADVGQLEQSSVDD